MSPGNDNVREAECVCIGTGHGLQWGEELLVLEFRKDIWVTTFRPSSAKRLYQTELNASAVVQSFYNVYHDRESLF